MKKYVVISLLIMLIINGCGKSDSSLSQPFVEVGDNDGVVIETHPIDIIDINSDQIIESVNSYDNLNADNSLYADIPESAPVLEFTERCAEGQNFEEYYKQYIEMFNYLFPNRDLQEEHLYYWGGSSQIEYDENGEMSKLFNNVNDNVERLKSGEDGEVALLYIEDIYGNKTEWDNPIDFEVGTQIGAGYLNFYKGKTIELMGKGSDGTYPRVSSFEPCSFFTDMVYYPPDSEESFNLLDGECKIKDAVQFYLDYMSKIPYAGESNVEMKVVEVGVAEVKEGIYGFYFQTTKSYKGIAYDYLKSGTVTLESTMGMCTFIGGGAFMVESDDIDYNYSYYKIQHMDSIKEYKSIVRFEKALDIVASSMTQDVTFEVKRIEFVYSQIPHITAEGYVQTDDGRPTDVSPVWKFELYNPNDDKYYRCYVSAVDATFTYMVTLQA